MIFKQVILSRLLDCHLLHPNCDQTSLQLGILEHRQCISSNIFQGPVLFVHFESDFGISKIQIRKRKDRDLVNIYRIATIRLSVAFIIITKHFLPYQVVYPS